MSTGNEIITSVGVASGDALVQDIKGSITSWTKDASTTGHFNAVNAAVTVGCVVAFADASIATIVAKTGDGTAANNITLSVDHASDFALASITGLIFSSPNAQPNYLANAVTTKGILTLGDTSTSSGYTCINFGASNANALTNGQYITKVSTQCGASTSSRTYSFHICKFVSGTTYNVTLLQTFTWSAAGNFTGTLTTPYLVPNDGGAYYLSYYSTTIYAGDGNIQTGGTGQRAYAAGNASGNTAFTVDNYSLRIQTTLQPYPFTVTYFAPTALFTANTNTIELNTSTWAGMSAVTATQTIPGSSTIWHGVSFNKGNSAESWQVYLSSVWRSIVQKSGSLWQYNDSATSTPNWVDATINSRLGALAQAFAVAANQMSATVLAAITAPQWASRFVAATLNFGVGMTADAANIPLLSQWAVTYTPTIAGAVTGSSAVVGSLAASTGKLLGADSPFSTVAGAVAASLGKLLGAATGTSTVAGTMKLPGDVDGHAVGQSTVVGAIQAKGRLAGAATGHSIVVGHAYAFIAPNTFIPIIQWRRVPR